MHSYFQSLTVQSFNAIKMLKLSDHHFSAIQSLSDETKKLSAQLSCFVGNNSDKIFFLRAQAAIESDEKLVRAHIGDEHTEHTDCRYTCMRRASLSAQCAFKTIQNIHSIASHTHTRVHNSSCKFYTEWMALSDARKCPENWHMVGEKPGAMTRQRVGALVADEAPDYLLDGCEARFCEIRGMLDKLIRLKQQCADLVAKINNLNRLIHELLAPTTWTLNVPPPDVVKVNIFVLMMVH